MPSNQDVARLVEVILNMIFTAGIRTDNTGSVTGRDHFKRLAEDDDQTEKQCCEP